ncbi:hypothetical protein N7456_009494 [Penicillium angulare]|uniref:Uncharacterized protein n=1 Tax=Penicillium angulare TaxID=116970 RepID=A0A9W9F4R3_9EURO|nr:hypothetical protein N7456_009494 [Penicillium angulare]
MFSNQLSSVTELNVGIFCACVPVFFVVIRTWMEKTESGFIHLRQRLTSRNSKETDVGIIDDSEAAKDHSRHPEVKLGNPNGTLTGVKSFFRKAGRTQTQGTEEQENTIHVSQYFELRSIDYDYHAQI